MNKGESAISIALTALLVLVVLGVQRRWNGSTFTNMASSAEDFVLHTTGLKSRIPDLPGFERVKTFRLGSYRAALYRASPAPLVFAAYRFILYNDQTQPVFKLDSVEATTQPWTTLYDFGGTRGLPDFHKRGPTDYTRDLDHDGAPEILLGQYSGGDHCCTTVTVIELGKDSAKVLGRITGLDGLPFEGLDIRRLGASPPGYKLIAHRPYHTVCGLHADAADVISIYDFQNGKITDQTGEFDKFLGSILQENLAKWKNTKKRSLHLLQTLATDYSATGEAAAGELFFEQNLPLFSSQLHSHGVDPHACLMDMANLINSVSTKVSKD